MDFEANLDLAGNLTAITDTTTAATALGEIETFIQTAVAGALRLRQSAASLGDVGAAGSTVRTSSSPS